MMKALNDFHFYLLNTLFVFGLYANSLRCGFTWDDRAAVVSDGPLDNTVLLFIFFLVVHRQKIQMLLD
jgi:hypothetical protein